MADFTPINTQEEFDAAIGDRLKRERETVSKKYGDYEDLKKRVADQEAQISTLTKERDDNAKKYAGYDKSLSELQAQVKAHETNSVKMRIAHETGIPFELAAKLSGETEEDIRKDAETMAKFVAKSKYVGPLKSDGNAEEDGNRAALKTMLQNMKGAK